MEVIQGLRSANIIKKAVVKSPTQNSDVYTAILIIVAFIVLYISSFLAIGLKKIKDNWDEYKCSPIAMPFAGYLGYDSMENFAFCIGKIQSALMNTFLKPVFNNLDVLGDVAGGILSAVSSLTVIMANMTTGFGIAGGDILNIFKGIMAKMQFFIVNMKDVFHKFAGTMVVITNMIQSGASTGTSLWRGPIGQTIQLLCFSPDTPVTMNDGTVKKMKNIKIGEKIKGGIDVVATLKIKGGEEHRFYKIWSKQLNADILVTGSHKIIDPKTGDLIPVKFFDLAEKTDMYSDTLSCLVTSTHIIPVGEYKFWDWED